MGLQNIFILVLVPLITILLLVALQVKLWGRNIHDLKGYHNALCVAAFAALLVSLALVVPRGQHSVGMPSFNLVSVPSPSSPKVSSIAGRGKGVSGGAFARPSF